MLVYEYVDNGNLEQWLHGDVGAVSPITWDIRMNIILGTAKGYYIYGLVCILNPFQCLEGFDQSDFFCVSFQTGLSS